MHALARPKLRAGCDAWTAERRRKSARPSPNRPSPPAQSMSRRVQPPQRFFGDPRMRNMESPPAALRTAQGASYPHGAEAGKEILRRCGGEDSGQPGGCSPDRSKAEGTTGWWMSPAPKTAERAEKGEPPEVGDFDKS